MNKLYSTKTAGPYTIGRTGAGCYEARNAKTGARAVFTTRQGAAAQISRWQTAARAEEQPALTMAETVRRHRDAVQWVANAHWEDRRVHPGKAG